jgi:hypothetical protein
MPLVLVVLQELLIFLLLVVLQAIPSFGTMDLYPKTLIPFLLERIP